MPSYKPKFGIRTILAITAVVAMATAWFLPFEPRISFSEPRKYKNWGEYDYYKTTITNHSKFPIWCRSFNGQVTSVGCQEAGTSNRVFFDGATVETFKRLGAGESTEICFSSNSDWVKFIVNVNVYDWRNRKFDSQSDAMSSQ